MGYKLKEINVENFKYIEHGKKKGIQLDNCDMAILDGPNGYGKSTLFDSIELLITGAIKHFNQDLPNRGKESLAILANNQNHDVLVFATFYNDSNEDLVIKRIFECQKDFNSKIFVDSDTSQKEIDQEQLYKILGINKSLFDIGVYISQSESLEFLQQKYKERKEQLTSILDSSQILSRIESMKNFRDTFQNRCDSQLSALGKEKTDLDEKIETLKQNIKELNERPESVLYQKIFEREFDFDKEIVDISKSYESTIQPLKDLELFLTDYDEYINTVSNNKIDDVINRDKREYIALYFRTILDEINEKRDIIAQIRKIQDYLPQYEEGNYTYDESVFTFLNLDTKMSLEVRKLLSDKQSAQRQLSNNQKLLNEIIEKRSQLFSTYHSAIDNGMLDKSHCPFCGLESDKIDTLFEDTTKLLKENADYSYGALETINKFLNNIFREEIIPLIKSVLEREQKLIHNHRILSYCSSITSQRLNEILGSFGIIDFYNKLDIIDMSGFEKDYVIVLDKLRQMKKTVEKIIPSQQIDKYKMLHTKYYNNIRPAQELADLQNKKYYITAQYSNKYNEKLSEYTELHKLVSEKYNALKQQSDVLKKNISDLCSKYEDAYKQYQTDIANSIRIPLFLFTGRIIQNYPMGLGVLVDVKENQVVFKAGGKDCDIFNILSTGQLNGVILSILLSVKSVFATQSGLNMLLIDDPLQSIDDISAYSFSDVLSEQFGDTQIIISTHEEDKANLFKFKCSQLGLKSHTYNMQKLYLSS